MVGLCAAHGRARKDRWRCVTEATVVFSTLHFVLEFGERWAGLFLHGQVKHAGRHVISHELNVDLDASSFLPLFAWLRLQGIPAKMRTEEARLSKCNDTIHNRRAGFRKLHQLKLNINSDTRHSNDIILCGDNVITQYDEGKKSPLMVMILLCEHQSKAHLGKKDETQKLESLEPFWHKLK